MTKTNINDLWIWANWPAPEHVRAGTSTRLKGFSTKPFNHLNLAKHVGDNEEIVNKNRVLMIKNLMLDSDPNWLNQTHSNKVVKLDDNLNDKDADASITYKKKQVCVVLTADCVPVLFCDSAGSSVAAAHAGWKGICNDIIENTIQQFQKPESLLAWIGPCICQHHYEVGEDVHSACLAHAEYLAAAFKLNSNNRWQCDLPHIIKLILKKSGINKIYESGLCTYKEKDLFYSYRRDGKTGRAASMIWME